MGYGSVFSACARTTVGAVLLTIAGFAPAVAQGTAPQAFSWRLQSAWPQANLLQESPVYLAKAIEEMSGGRLKMSVMPAGTVVGAFEVLDAVHKNVIDAAHAWPGY